ncbi:GNAT family N-acetyltransferase [Aminiphilus sp.]|uniref:GNAT family N-acetyltransferase n=1 Tax=Aminiphilus sp. TaxID=1872488 RepID=UPI00262C5798|nr:GNAT family N-acetyltransferase [Aminiphilus sp.]
MNEEIDVLLEMAARTGAFTPQELEVLEEVLRDTLRGDGDAQDETAYRLCTLREQDRPAGFLIYGRTPMTAFAYDLYWIVVDPALHCTGVGCRLVAAMEDALRALTGRGIVRVETSGKEEYAGQRVFYERCGFSLVGRIADFYRSGDDLLTYVKVVS